MEDFRANAPKEIAGSPVVTYKDFRSLKKVENGVESDMEMPDTSNVLQYFCADTTKLSIRPSGTEPKIKFYIEVNGKMNSAADYAKCCEEAEAKCNVIMKSLGL